MLRLDLQGFLRKVAADEALRRDVVELAARHGYVLRLDELPDSALEAVAGGGVDTGSKYDLKGTTKP